MNGLKSLFVVDCDVARRVIGLDALRCLAIILVVMSHGRHMVPCSPSLGFYGVELFFVLSGFLIGRILMNMFCDPVNFKDVLNFWIRRWFRTIPNYYLFLVGSIFLAISSGVALVSTWKYFAFLQCITYRKTPFMGESWSLCVEEWFYLLFPLWLLGWFGIFRKIERRQVVFLATLAFIVSITLMRFGVALLSPARSLDAGFRCCTLLRLDAIAYGVLAAWYSFYKKDVFLRHKFWIGLLGCIGLIFAHNYANYSDFFVRTVRFSVVSLSVALLLPFFCDARIKGKWLRYAIVHLSVISYSVYLMHYSFVLFFLKKTSWPNWAEYIVYWGATLLLSTLVYNLFERRMTRVRDHLSRKEVSV